MARNKKRKQISSRERLRRQLASEADARLKPDIPHFLPMIELNPDGELVRSGLPERWTFPISVEPAKVSLQFEFDKQGRFIRSFDSIPPIDLNRFEEADKEKIAEPKTHSWVKNDFEFKVLQWASLVLTSRVLSVARKEIVPIAPLLFLAALTCPRDQRDAVVGDMRERYPKDCSAWGPGWAKTLIVRDILAAIGPMIWSIGRKGVLTGLKALGIAEMVRRFMG